MLRLWASKLNKPAPKCNVVDKTFQEVKNREIDLF